MHNDTKATKTTTTTWTHVYIKYKITIITTTPTNKTNELMYDNAKAKNKFGKEKLKKATQ